MCVCVCGGGAVLKFFFFSALRASVWSKNKGGPPLDPPLCRLPISVICIKGKQKRYFVRSFWDHMDPCAYLPKWSRYAPDCARYWLACSLTVAGLELWKKKDRYRHSLFYDEELRSLGVGSRGRAVCYKGGKDNQEREAKVRVIEKSPGAWLSLSHLSTFHPCLFLLS